MTIQSYFYLIVFSVTTGLIAFNYHIPEQVINNETASTNSFLADHINQECSKTTINNQLQPELILDWEFPSRLVSAGIR